MCASAMMSRLCHSQATHVHYVFVYTATCNVTPATHSCFAVSWLIYGALTLSCLQANNAYIFPAVGHAAVLCKARTIPNEVFLVTAEALAGMTTLEEVHHGYLFPAFSHIREVSVKLMAAVGSYMVDRGIGTQPEGFNGDWEACAEAAMWDVPTGELVTH